MQLRPVSIPDIVGHMAGKDPVQKIADFDRHYMPDGLPAPDASANGNADAHPGRSDLKRKADGIPRSDVMGRGGGGGRHLAKLSPAKRF